ncbi:hypothetical protein UCDDA912_g02913 [Diaporthe ampelina]|uniref:Uncharacterized protein n=1 Tax=Diaporthe ampelina TaxID=1214573 RepID=A0A0G2FSA6_9PEZI|nr:hypothetical protein UCDDA912_g02913 [Diaporthe ampelina]
MDSSNIHNFQENDIQLLKTGNFSDGIEATNKEVGFANHDPDSVDLMLQHLYRENLDVEDLKTPAICVRCWKLADYLQLESLKTVAVSSLREHLDTMAWLACGTWTYNDGDIPTWLICLLDAVMEVCIDETTKPLVSTFAAFLWVTRFEVLVLPHTLDCLAESHSLNKTLVKLLALNGFGEDEDWPEWIPDTANTPREIKNKDRITYEHWVTCADCDAMINTKDDVVIHNPFPSSPMAVA